MLYPRETANSARNLRLRGQEHQLANAMAPASTKSSDWI